MPSSRQIIPSMRSRFSFPHIALALAIQAQIAPAAPGDVDELDLNVGGGPIVAMAEQPDGKTILAGFFTSILGMPRNYIARLNADGTLDMDFDPNPNGDVMSVAVQTDGKVLLAGGFNRLGPNGTTPTALHAFLARVHPDGTLDNGFDPKPFGIVYSVVVQADGDVLIGGNFKSLQPNGTVSPSPRRYIARVHADGTLDGGFNPNPNREVYSIAVQDDGQVLLGGTFTTLQPNGVATPTTRNYVARVHADGTIDSEFDPNPNGHVSCLATQSDGKILLGGYFLSIRPGAEALAVPRQGLARIHVDGTLDMEFDPYPHGRVTSLAVQADGKVLLSGLFTELQPNGAVVPSQRNAIARVHADGALDTGFDPNPVGSVTNVGLQADGKVLLGGNMLGFQPNGQASFTPRKDFARLLNDPASQTLSVPSANHLTWARGGAGPEVYDVTFESSTDGGTTWTDLGSGARVAGGWERTGLSLPIRGSVRARGRTSGGYWNGSSGLIEQVTSFNFYQTWAATAMPGASEAQRAPGADFDGDGKENGWEYFIGSDPALRETADLTQIPISGSTLLVHPRRLGLEGAVWRVEHSTDAVHYVTLPPSQYTHSREPLLPGLPPFTLIAIPHGTEPRRFYRIVVEM